MASHGKVVIDVTLNNSNVTADIRRLEQQFRNFTNSFTRDFNSSTRSVESSMGRMNGSIQNVLSSTARNAQAAGTSMRESFSQSSRTSSQQIIQNFQRAGQGMQRPLVSSANVVNRSFSSMSSASTTAVGRIISGYSSVVAKTQRVAGTIKTSFSNGFTVAQNAGINAMNRIKQSMRDVEKTNHSVVSGILKGAALITGISSTVDLLGRAINRVDVIDTATKSLEVLTGSSEKAKLVINDVVDAIQGTPIALNDVALGAKKMVAAGMEAEKVKPVFTAIADAAFGVGDGAESIDQITDAFASMQSAGTVYADDINRLVDAGIPAWQMLANQTGKSVAEIKDHASKGLLSSNEAIDMLVKGIEEGTDGVAGHTAAMAGLAKTAGDTISGSWANLKTAIVTSVANIADVLKGDIIGALQNLTDKFKALGEITKSEGFKNGLLAMVGALKTFVNVIGSAISVMKPFTPVLLGIVSAFMTFKAIVGVTALVTQAIGGLVLAFNAMKLAMMTNPFTAIIAATVGLSVALVALYKTNETFRNGVIAIWGAVKSAFIIPLTLIGGMLDIVKNKLVQFGQVLSTIPGVAKLFWNSFKDSAIFAGLVSVLGMVASGVRSLGSALGSVPSVAQGFFNAFKNSTVFTVLSNVIVDFIGKIKDVGLAFKELITTGDPTQLIEKFATFIPTIIGFLIGGIPQLLLTGMTLFKSLADGMGLTVPELIQKVTDVIVGMITTFVETLPQFLQMGIDILMRLIEGINQQIPMITQVIVEVITGLINTFVEMLPQFLQIGIDLLMQLINGILEALPQLIEAITNIITSFTQTILEALPQILTAGINIITALIDGIIQSLPQIIGVVLLLITTLLTQIVEMLPTLLDAGIQMLTAIIDGLISAAPQIINAIIQVITALLDMIITMLPALLSAGIQIIMALIDGLMNALPQIIDAVIKIVLALVDTIIKNLPKIIDAGIKILMALIDGIMKILPQLIDTAIKLIMKIVETLIANLPKIIDAGMKLLMALISGIIQILPQLVATGLTLIVTLVGELIKNLPKILEAGVKLIKELIKGIISMAKNLGSSITKDIIPKIVDTLKKVDLLQVGKGIIKSLIKGIGSMANELMKTVGNLANSVLDGFKGIFGFGSSSGGGKGGKGKRSLGPNDPPPGGPEGDILSSRGGGISLNKAASDHINIPKYSLDSVLGTGNQNNSRALRTSTVTQQMTSNKYDDREIKTLLKEIVRKTGGDVYLGLEKVGSVMDDELAKRTGAQGRRVLY
ncbi:tape measure protein [Bacillus cereus]